MMAGLHLLRVQVEQGELALAERNLEAWGASGPLPDTAFGNRLLIERGRLRLAQDRPSEAMRRSAGRRATALGPERLDSVRMARNGGARLPPPWRTGAGRSPLHMKSWSRRPIGERNGSWGARCSRSG